MVRHQVLVLAFGGSNPSIPAKRNYLKATLQRVAFDFMWILCYNIGMFLDNIEKRTFGGQINETETNEKGNQKKISSRS